MKFSLAIVAFMAMFMFAMVPARASPLEFTTMYNLEEDKIDLDFAGVAVDDMSEDFDRMSVVTTNLIEQEQPLRTPVGHGAESSLTTASSGSEVALTGVGISS